MKKFSVFLALSLAANAAFLVTFFLRPAPATRTPTPAATVSGATATAAPGELTPAQLAAIASGDLAQLKAAKVPDDLARSLVIGRAFAKLQARQRALSRPPDINGRYWTNAATGFRNRTKEDRAELSKAQREFSEALRAVDGEPVDYGSIRYGFLPAAKRNQLSRIVQDYSEMRDEIYSDMNGIQLPSDREKMRLLRQEQEHDIAAALSPEEYEQYNLRVSQSASTVRNRYGDAIQTEEEYRKIFALQKAFDDQYANQEMFAGGPPSQEAMTARRTAEAKLQQDIRAAVGEENYAAFQRATDQEYKALNSVAKRLNLPPTTADSVFAARDTYAAKSQQINQDTSLSSQDRKTQLQALATQARTDLQATLGAEGAEAYAQQARWLNYLKNGNAFSTNPQDAPRGAPGSMNTSVFPLPSPRPAPPAVAPSGG